MTGSTEFNPASPRKAEFEWVCTVGVGVGRLTSIVQPSVSVERRAVLELSGSGARSVKLHGLVVYLDKELTLRKANPSTVSAPTKAPQSEGAARAQRPVEDLTSRQRRSRRRLEERIAQRAEQRQPQLRGSGAQPRGGDERAAIVAATGRVLAR